MKNLINLQYKMLKVRNTQKIHFSQNYEDLENFLGSRRLNRVQTPTKYGFI